MVLLSTGHPFFPREPAASASGWCSPTARTGEEIHELVTESYRILVPKKLTALLD